MHDVARGDEVDDLDAVQVIGNAGRSVDEFEADVELVKRRIGWRAELDAEAELESEYRELIENRDTEVEQINAKIDELRQKRKAVQEEGDARISSIRSKLDRSRATRQQLVSSYAGHLDVEGDTTTTENEIGEELRRRTTISGSTSRT